VGNISLDPQLASASHLSADSPCRGAGSAAYASGTDIDSEPWARPPSIGCDEYHAGAVTGPLTVAITATFTSVLPGYAVQLTALIEGQTTGSVWILAMVPLSPTSHTPLIPGQLWAIIRSSCAPSMQVSLTAQTRR